MESGIYKIYNTKTHQYYIGQSINVCNRLNTHKQELRRKKHTNQHLQSDFIKYGETTFIFEKIYDCEEEYLNVMERYFMDKYEAVTKGYNKVAVTKLVRDNVKRKQITKRIIHEFEQLDFINIELDKQIIISYKALKDLEYLCVDIEKNIDLHEKARKIICNIIDIAWYDYTSEIEEYIHSKMCRDLLDKFNKEIIIKYENASDCWDYIWGESKDEYYIEFDYIEILTNKEKRKRMKINLIEKQ